MSSSVLSALSNSRRLRWLLALPKLGIILLLVALVSLLWLLQRNEAEEERAALIKDVLWLEQNLQFHLNSNEEQLQQLALDMANLPERQRLWLELQQLAVQQRLHLHGAGAIADTKARLEALRSLVAGLNAALE